MLGTRLSRGRGLEAGRLDRRHHPAVEAAGRVAEVEHLVPD
jgi:hypothetical protein